MTIRPLQLTKELFLNLLFPRFCVGCGEEGGWLCSKCSHDIVAVVSQVCPECTRLSKNGQYHLKCAKGKSLKGIIASAYFEEGPIREMIHNFKYNGVTELAEPLAKMMAGSLYNVFCIKDNRKISKTHHTLYNFHNTILVPVPLHWRRQAVRGYNQSELLAWEVGRQTNLPVYSMLKKCQNTKRQVTLSGETRRKNLTGVFSLSLSNLSDLRNLRIILVDDVYTTGSTLNECARVLKKAGAKEVWGLVVARG